jgi:hypothetical protein
MSKNDKIPKPKIRKSWRDLDPVTKVEPAARGGKYNRKQAKEEWQNEVEDALLFDEDFLE